MVFVYNIKLIANLKSANYSYTVQLACAVLLSQIQSVHIAKNDSPIPISWFISTLWGVGFISTYSANVEVIEWIGWINDVWWIRILDLVIWRICGTISTPMNAGCTNNYNDLLLQLGSYRSRLCPRMSFFIRSVTEWALPDLLLS